MNDHDETTQSARQPSSAGRRGGVGDLPVALSAYAAARRWHVRLYQALSLGFTPFYQADGRILPWVRDHVLGKVARLPLAPRLLAATVSGLLLDPRPRDRH